MRISESRAAAQGRGACPDEVGKPRRVLRPGEALRKTKCNWIAGTGSHASTRAYEGPAAASPERRRRKLTSRIPSVTTTSTGGLQPRPLPGWTNSISRLTRKHTAIRSASSGGSDPSGVAAEKNGASKIVRVKQRELQNAAAKTPSFGVLPSPRSRRT